MDISKKIIISSLFLLVILASPYFANAIEYGGLGVYPNVSEVDSSNSLTKAWFIYALEEGASKKAKINIVNTSDGAITVEIYPVDAVTTKDGAFAPEPRDKKKVDVGSWITLDETELELAPREVKIVDFTIRVPKDVEVGDHMGAIIAQNKESSDRLAGSGMRITTRVGARIYITIPGNIVRKLEFNDFSQQTQERIVTFHSSFENEGNVRIRLSGNIEIIDAFGEIVDTLQIPEREVFPKKTITISVEWKPDDEIGGDFTARAEVSYEQNKTLNKELSFSVPYGKQVSEHTSSLVAALGSVGMGIGLGFGVSIALMAGLYLILRRQPRRIKRRINRFGR